MFLKVICVQFAAVISLNDELPVSLFILEGIWPDVRSANARNIISCTWYFFGGPHKSIFFHFHFLILYGFPTAMHNKDVKAVSSFVFFVYLLLFLPLRRHKSGFGCTLCKYFVLPGNICKIAQYRTRADYSTFSWNCTMFQAENKSAWDFGDQLSFMKVRIGPGCQSKSVVLWNPGWEQL